MADFVKFKWGKKLHLLSTSGKYTMCGKKVPANSIQIDKAKGDAFCDGCYLFVGKEMIIDFIGLDALAE